MGCRNNKKLTKSFRVHVKNVSEKQINALLNVDKSTGAVSLPSAGFVYTDVVW